MNPDERAEEITVQELNKLLDTEYFSNLKHIGIAGGEPLQEGYFKIYKKPDGKKEINFYYFKHSCFSY